MRGSSPGVANREAKSSVGSPHPGPLPKGEGDLKASAERGKRLFETQGCLACHQHADFPLAASIQGPDLSRIGAKYRPANGVRWLADWIGNPAQFRADTTMPQLILGATPAAAADIAAYLIRGGAAPPISAGISHLSTLNSQLLRELGRRAIARRGCFACHDIPGFDGARPIGPSLSDWGRKQESLLAFAQVGQFVAAGEGATAENRFFLDALRHNRREGFLWQKLRARAASILTSPSRKTTTIG